MASILSVEQLQGLAAGSTPNTITIPTGQKIVASDVGSVVAPGTVVQIIQQDFSSQTFNNSLAPGSRINGDISITPKFATSKIYVMCEQTNERGVADTANRANYYMAALYRNGYSGQLGPQIENAAGHATNGQTRQYFAGHWFDSPGTTNATTYGVYANGGQNINNTVWVLYNCRMTVWEIAQ